MRIQADLFSSSPQAAWNVRFSAVRDCLVRNSPEDWRDGHSVAPRSEADSAAGGFLAGFVEVDFAAGSAAGGFVAGFVEAGFVEADFAAAGFAAAGFAAAGSGSRSVAV